MGDEIVDDGWIIPGTLAWVFMQEERKMAGTQTTEQTNPNRRPELALSDLRVGDTVYLQWNGFDGVPMWAGGSKGVVVGFGRTRPIVKAPVSIDPLRPRMSQVTYAWRDGVPVVPGPQS